ncbi:MAG TPA: protein kinase, partial [Ktedonobacteraceae bacterium]|nr:protein kinase [Ktedonobacteraceae bacterium]
FVTRFQREAKAASALQHPNIVQVYDYGQSDGNYFIVMELIDGTDLRRYLRSRGILATERAIIIAHDIALGLGAAHRRGIVHRDVKPQNVLVGRDGSIKLTDFGIASVYKDINDERLTTTGMTLGTVQYYAPEQAQGEIVSPAADVYALGIVMYEMMTGRTPFDGDTPVAVAMAHIQDPPTPPSHLNPNIPAALEEIILRCLEKVPEMRYRDGNVLARALESLGDASLATGTTPTLSSNSTIISPSTSGTQHQIPHRPNATPNGLYAPSHSSPNNQMEPQFYAQGQTVSDDAPTYRVDQNYIPMAAGQPGAMADYDPNAAPYGGMPPLATGTGE